MQVILLKSKIHGATVTQAELTYDGSLTLDRTLMEAANLSVGERVQIVNLNNGSRIETYLVEGEENSGVVCLNGPAARTGLVGDRVHVLSYGVYGEEEAADHRPRIVRVNDENSIVE